MAKLPGLLFGVVMLAAAATSVAAQAVDEQALRAALVERVDVRKWGTGIVVGISSPQGRQVVSYGRSSVQDRRKVDGSTVFEIASLTKIFTALVLADMAASKEMTMNAPVSSCLPEHKP